MDPVNALDTALANTARLVRGVGPDQWSAPTPCDQWDVRQLVTHAAGVIANFRNAARNEELAGNPDDFDLGADPGATLAALADETVAAWRERGELDSTVRLGDNEFPGAVAISINTLDAYVHGWDIARATGQDAQLDDDLCAGILAFAQQAVPAEPREGDNFHAVVPTGDDAGPADRLIGYLGRQP